MLLDWFVIFWLWLLCFCLSFLGPCIWRSLVGFCCGFWWFGYSLLLNGIWCLLVFEWLFLVWVAAAVVVLDVLLVGLGVLGWVWWVVGGGLCGLVCSMWLVNSVDLFKFFLNLMIWCGVVFLDSYNVVAFGLNVLIVVFVDSWFVGC